MRKFILPLVLSASCIFVLFGAVLPQAQAQETTLHLFNWPDYIDPAIPKSFGEEYGVKVSLTYYESNSQMFAKLQAGGSSQYDVIFPSDFYVPRLVDSGLVQPLNKDLIPNAKNVLEEFSDPPFDPGLKYSMPYQWGSTGIVYDTNKLPDPPKTWGLIYDPELNSKYQFALMNATQESLGTACAYLGLGYDCNTVDDWKEAAKLIIATRRRPNFAGFVEGTPSLHMVARGNIAAGIAYIGDFLAVKRRDPASFEHVDIFIPEGSAELWVDSMMIPVNAPNPDLANEFINYVLRADKGADLSNFNAYPSPNKAAEPYLDDDIRQSPITPSPETMEYLRYTPVLSGQDLQLFDQLWTEAISR